MKDCVRFAPMMGAHPGELSDEETRALAEHLASCDACQAWLADAEAISALLPDALLAEANRRDFSTFSDEVLARIPEYRVSARPERRPAHPERSGEAAESEGGREPSILARLGSWARHHRAAAVASVLAPAAAAIAIVVYFGHGSPPEQHAAIEVISEGHGTMVLETNEGPVVLIGNGSAEGT